MSDISSLRRALISRVTEGEGRASPAMRRSAYDNAGLDEPVRTLVDKVARNASTVADADIAAVLGIGLSEDEIFEIVVCAAIGQAARQYETALAALDAVTGGR